MAKLTSSERAALPGSAFALPGRRYPIHNEGHARDALVRVSENGTPGQISIVRKKVKARYPSMNVVGTPQSTSVSSVPGDTQVE